MSKFIVSELRKYLKTCEHVPSMVTGLILGSAIGPDLVHEVLSDGGEPIVYKSVVRWRAEKSGTYYYVDENGDILWTWENNTERDDERYNMGNYYRSHQDAERRKND